MCSWRARSRSCSWRFFVQPALADTGRRVALVIGNGAYQNALHLPNPPNDAKAVAEALRGLDFEVIEAVDLDQPDMLARLDEFSAKLEGADTGLFYYAGHGLQVGGENYLVPIDARLQREAQVHCRRCRCRPFWRPWRRRSPPASSCSTPAATTRWRSSSSAAWPPAARPRSARAWRRSAPLSAR